MAIISTATNPTWRKSIIQQLQEQQRKTNEPFESVIQTCVSLFEKIDSLQREKSNSSSSSTTANCDNQTLSNPIPSSSSTASTTATTTLTSATNSTLNDRIQSLQNDLKECQKCIMEKDSTIIELNTKITSLMKEKNDLKSKQTDLKINLDCMLDKCRAYEEVINDLKGQNTCLIDEHTALQILYDSLKNKFDKLNQQYNDLVTKVMETKAKDAEIMNEENEKMIRLQQERLRKQLEDDANRIMVTSNVENDSVNLIENPVTVIIPERPRINFEPHNEIYALKFDKKTNYLSSGGGDRKVKLWNFDDIKINLIQVLTGSNASVTSIDIFEEYLVASSSDYASRVWTLNDFRLRRTLTGHSNKVMSVKFMSVNNKVVSGSYDKTIKVWDLNRNACMRTLFAGSSCTDIANRDENFFASGHIDKHIRFWDSRIETSSATGIQLQGKITSLNVTNNGHYLVAAIRNVDKLTCLDLRMNSFVQNYTADSFTIGWDWTRLCLSPNDQYIACGGNDSQIFFWDFSSGKLLKTLSTDKHIGTIIAVEWHPKGNLFASADRNKNIVLWS
ncbi:autophagy-related 16 [Dermatophagoides pteronyssinus]|uniref:Autophagy-related protein 16-1-like n=1 Tax=Dermatophagoides pteronyssinus TaxID=6956 RepID=A0A6P6XPW0_DERPT|nr:autophagy-related protein 16-1-like [Dermatophagoides pteronyssinus]